MDIIEAEEVKVKEEVEERGVVEVELEVIEPVKLQLATVFQPNGLDPLVAQVQVKVDEFLEQSKKLDMTKKSDREAVTKFANRLTKVRTTVDKVNKEYVAELKQLPAQVSAEGKRFIKIIEDMQELIKKPVTEFEAAEAKKQAEFQEKMQSILNMAFTDGISSEDIKKRIDELENMDFSVYGENHQKAMLEVARVMPKLRTAHTARIKYEADQAELVELRKQKAELEKAAAEQKAKEVAEAKQAEVPQVVEETKQPAPPPPQVPPVVEQYCPTPEVQKPATRKVTSDPVKIHQGKINREIVAGLLNYGVDEEQAKSIVIGILSKKIPHLTINY